MRKIALSLCLSFLFGMVNASTMPIFSNGPAHDVPVSTHSHCEEATNQTSHSGSDPISKLSVGHYCCSVIAFLGISIAVDVLVPPSFFVIGEIPRPSSNITEAPYKPPKTYL